MKLEPLIITFPLEKAALRNKKNLQHYTNKIVRNILGATWSKSQTFPDHKKTTSLKFLKILNVESQRSSPRSFKGRETAF